MTKISISEADARESLRDFGLEQSATAIRPIVGGQGNQSFIVTTESGDHVLTFCIEKQIEEVRVHAGLLLALEEVGFPASRVVRTQDGELSGAFGGYITLLKQFIAGECPSAATRATGHSIGVLLARLHGIKPVETTIVGHPYGFGHFAEVADCEPFSTWLQGQQAHLEASLGGCADRVLIHGDLFPDNVLVSGDDVRGAIDFEEACFDWAGLDLGMALVGFSLLPTKQSGWIDQLLAGYRSVRESPDIELVSVFAEYAATATAFWRFRQFEFRKREVSTSSSYREMVRLAERLRLEGLSAMS